MEIEAEFRAKPGRNIIQRRREERNVMPNSVYHFHFLNELLPESDEDRAVFARENTAKLTAGAESDVIFYMQPHNHEPTCLLTISVPERLTQVHGTLRAAGAVPAFQEPEGPYWEDNTSVLPGSFQVLRSVLMVYDSVSS